MTIRTAVAAAALLLRGAGPVAAQTIDALAHTPQPARAEVRRGGDDASVATMLRSPRAFGTLVRIDTTPAARSLTTPRLWLALRMVAAGTAAVLLSVDNDNQWRRCADRYPDPYPHYDLAWSRPYYDGLCLRRWQHHAARVYIAATTDETAREALGLRSTPAAILTVLAVGAAPHVVSRLTKNGDTPATTGDAAADVWITSMPLAMTLPKRLGGRWTGFALWAVGYAALAPYARP